MDLKSFSARVPNKGLHNKTYKRSFGAVCLSVTIKYVNDFYPCPAPPCWNLLRAAHWPKAPYCSSVAGLKCNRGDGAGGPKSPKLGDLVYINPP